ncbi:hypothetical protein VB715_00415 [Crocosphaera sp. UHCC 0190]|nr:hypothetical protein [Crocosphaera sp. UHCC 0190]MEA5508217.1 hypothetical protein [Crocosphaera sp. UHCC 0190]
MFWKLFKLLIIKEYYGYTNGAAQTGRLAAQVVINSLQKLSATVGVNGR